MPFSNHFGVPTYSEENKFFLFKYFFNYEFFFCCSSNILCTDNIIPITEPALQLFEHNQVIIR